MLRTLQRRALSAISRPISSARLIGSTRRFASHAKEPDQFVSLTFVDLDGEMTTVQAKCGDSVMDAAVKNEIHMPAECNGQGGPPELFGWGPSCTTCMVYIPEKYLMKIDPMKWDEGDKLKDAFHATINSRLSCCVEVTPELDGAHIGLPEYPLAFDDYDLYHRPEWARRNQSEAHAERMKEGVAKLDAEQDAREANMH